jgi:integrase
MEWSDDELPLRTRGIVLHQAGGHDESRHTLDIDGAIDLSINESTRPDRERDRIGRYANLGGSRGGIEETEDFALSIRMYLRDHHPTMDIFARAAFVSSCCGEFDDREGNHEQDFTSAREPGKVNPMALYPYLTKMAKSVTIRPRHGGAKMIEPSILTVDLPLYFSKEEVQRFFAVIPRPNKRDRALFDLIYRHGLRRREASLLLLANVALTGRSGLLGVTRLKGSKSGVYRLHPSSVRHVRAYLSERGKDENPYLFPGRRAGSALSPSMIYQLFRRYALAAHLPLDRCHPHSFRHSWGVHAANERFDLLDIADWLGHKSLATAMRYAAVTNHRRDQNYDRVLNSKEFARTT